MWYPPENDAYAEELYLAGERVSAGMYKQVGGARQIRVELEDVLPATLDGQVACYVRVHTWAELRQTWTTADELSSSRQPRSAG